MTHKDKDHLATARKRFAECVEAEGDNRRRAEEADKFSAGLEQWPADLKRNRELDDRPCLVMDETNQYINQIKNDQRQNKAAIKVRPVDDKADKKVAEMLQGVIRHIEDTSNADIAYDTASEQALRGGFGYFRVVTDYCYEDSFEQEIKIERIRDRNSVYLDPMRQMPDGSDAKWGFVTEWMKREDFTEAYPDADPVSWKSDQKEMVDWVTEDSIQIADYYFFRETERELVQLPDGTTAYTSEIPEGISTDGLRKRTTTQHKLIWQKITGAEVLEETEWMGKYIPIIEMIGNESIVDGKRILTGIVHSAMDAQKMHNFAISSMVEHIVLAPKSPNIAAAGQLEGFEEQWKDANRRNIPVLTYNPLSVDGVAVPPPQRQPPPGLSSGYADMVMASRTWVQSAMGMYNASVGAEGNEKSGKAILAKQREGDTGSFHYHDNRSISVRHAGRILVDLIPKIYDTRRVVRILGEDGKPETVMFDPDLKRGSKEVKQEDGSLLMLYNPTIGKYDVAVSSGPSYTTKRQEAAETQMQLVQANPTMFPLVGDIMIRNMDWPGADQMADRLQKMLPENLKEEKPDESQLEVKAGQLQQIEKSLMQKAQQLFEKEQQMSQAEQMLNDKVETTSQETSGLEDLKKEIEALKAEVLAERRILAAEKAKVMAELKAADAQAQLDAMTAQTQEHGEKTESENQAIESLATAMLAMIDENRGISQGMGTMQASIAEMLEQMRAPKSISYLDGEVDSVGGRKAIYDEQGNIVGLSGLN